MREEDTDRDEDDGGTGGDGRLHFSDVHTGTGGSAGGTSLEELKALSVTGRTATGGLSKLGQLPNGQPCFECCPFGLLKISVTI